MTLEEAKSLNEGDLIICNRCSSVPLLRQFMQLKFKSLHFKEVWAGEPCVWLLCCEVKVAPGEYQTNYYELEEVRLVKPAKVDFKPIKFGEQLSLF